MLNSKSNSNKETRDSDVHFVYSMYLPYSQPEWTKVGKCDSVYDRLRTHRQGSPTREHQCSYFIFDEKRRGQEIEAHILQKLEEEATCTNGEWIMMTQDEVRSVFENAVNYFGEGAYLLDIDKTYSFSDKRQDKYWPKCNKNNLKEAYKLMDYLEIPYGASLKKNPLG